MALVKRWIRFLVYLCLTLPLSSWAGEPSGNAIVVPSVPPTAFQSRGSTIWKAGIGEGFLSGTQVLSLSAGASYGALMLDGKERHHFSLLAVSYGQIIGDMEGANHWYHGNWECRGELLGGVQLNAGSQSFLGLAPHLRYYFATGKPYIPYIDLGAGITLTDIHEPDLGGAFQFNLQAGVGLSYFITDRSAISLEGRYLHLSSAGISRPNFGVNSIGVLLGHQRLF